MGKIIVIGCGQGGLVAAKHLADYGHKVIVYEAKAREDACYPWRDDIRRAVFEEAGLTPLPVEDCVQKSKWKFVSPDEKSSLKVPMTPPLEEISISRRYLLDRLIGECAGCEIKFSTPVERLVVEGEKVKGVIVNGAEISADLVIDASGFSSPFRAQAPSPVGIPEPQPDDALFAFRGYYEINKDAELPIPPCTLYVKHMGGDGISWCNLTPDGSADVLIARIGGLLDEEIDGCKKDLLNNHAFNTGTPIFEKKVKIALRYPATVMVTDGYAVVGDSAYMTMPLMGSGIESSMKAGKLLADCVNKDDDFSAAKLYGYQRAFWEKFGYDYTFIDVIKRWALALPEKEVNWAFGCGLVTDEDMALLSTDENQKGMGVGTIISKIGIALKNFPLVRQAIKYAVRGLRAKSYAKKIPKTYDPIRLKKWADKLDNRVRGK